MIGWPSKCRLNKEWEVQAKISRFHIRKWAMTLMIYPPRMLKLQWHSRWGLYQPMGPSRIPAQILDYIFSPQNHQANHLALCSCKIGQDYVRRQKSLKWHIQVRSRTELILISCRMRLSLPICFSIEFKSMSFISLAFQYQQNVDIAVFGSRPLQQWHGTNLASTKVSFSLRMHVFEVLETWNAWQSSSPYLNFHFCQKAAQYLTSTRNAQNSNICNCMMRQSLTIIGISYLRLQER